MLVVVLDSELAAGANAFKTSAEAADGMEILTIAAVVGIFMEL